MSPFIKYCRHQNLFLKVFNSLQSNKLINNKTFEHASLIFTEPWALANEIMLNIMQKFKLDFLENQFWADWGVHFKFHFQNLSRIFQRDFGSMYRGILELKTY